METLLHTSNLLYCKTDFFFAIKYAAKDVLSYNAFDRTSTFVSYNDILYNNNDNDNNNNIMILKIDMIYSVLFAN